MKLRAMSVSNFAGIGEPEITIPIDNIVVLIGPNNSGKSSILEAYEAFASTGSPLTIKSFHNEESKKPIVITGTFNELTKEDKKILGEKWIYDDPAYSRSIKVKWQWTAPDQKASKFSWDNDEQEWVAGGMGGWDTLITNRTPFPLRVKPTDDPENTEKQIIEILTAAAKAALKKDSNKAMAVLNELQKLADEFAEVAQKELNDVCSNITKRLSCIFPDHEVNLQQSVGDFSADKIISTGSHIRIKEPGKDSVPLSHQGAGLRRTFLWSALGTLAEAGRAKQGRKVIDAERQRMLLIEEPESFLHPPLIRSARDALYELAEVAEWQILTCTHSPIFIDVSKPHTTILRVEKKTLGNPRVFSSDKAHFSDDDREQLRMVRSCHPTVAEFFFADQVILVEGETEQAVFSIILSTETSPDGSWSHVVNCMGKANIPLFIKILNQFGTPYIAIHDSDSPKIERSNKWATNAMWTINRRIVEACEERQRNLPVCRLLANIPDFEFYYFGDKITKDKPFNAISKLNDPTFRASGKYAELTSILTPSDRCAHPGIYKTYEDLKHRVASWVEKANPKPAAAWAFDD